MAKKLYDLAVKTGTYTDGQGQQKGRWQNVGAVMQNDDGGQFIMLAKWFNPAGVPDLSGKGASSESVLVSMFEPQQRDGGGQQQRQQPQQRQQQPRQQQRQAQHDMDDDVPF